MEEERLSASWGTELTKIFKTMTNDNYSSMGLGVSVGTIISRSPFGISLYDGNVLIYDDIHSIYKTETITKSSIETGDNVVVIASNDNQSFFVIDKIKRGD